MSYLAAAPADACPQGPRPGNGRDSCRNRRRFTNDHVDRLFGQMVINVQKSSSTSYQLIRSSDRIYSPSRLPLMSRRAFPGA
jgi:hypothetical protein